MKIICFFLILSLNAQAEVLLKDIGVIGLASHDLFTWDRVNEVNLENGRLDLSTIFDFDNGENWKKGGNPKNAENAPVYTITMSLVDNYRALLKVGMSPQNARKEIVKSFHAMVKDSFERMIRLPFPEQGIDAQVTNIEQAAMRGLHDILPGRVKLFDRLGRKELNIANVWFAKTKLNMKELNQVIPDYNGDYDQEYQAIKIPFSSKIINLKTIDAEFIDKFSPYRQDEMLQELILFGKEEISADQVSFMQHLTELFSKGICSLNNYWMPEKICN
jgi:glycogen debranching enzyme